MIKKWQKCSESLVRVPEPPSTRRGGFARASRGSSSSNTPLTITQRSDGTRPRHAVDAEMGTPVLVGARGRDGRHTPPSRRRRRPRHPMEAAKAAATEADPYPLSLEGPFPFDAFAALVQVVQDCVQQSKPPVKVCLWP